MTVYLLDPQYYGFPDPEMADPGGLLAVGGDLCIARLLSAYYAGVYPCYGPDNPILWWSPDPRPIILPAQAHPPKRLLRQLRKTDWLVTLDRDFKAVIAACASSPRPGHSGIWLLPEIMRAYTELNQAGLAHSVEVWEGDELIGGLYGISLGKAFFGESMFHQRSNASKAALLALIRILADWEFHFIDCQQDSAHINMLGAVSVRRHEFGRLLAHALTFPTIRGQWEIPQNFSLNNLTN